MDQQSSAPELKPPEGKESPSRKAGQQKAEPMVVGIGASAGGLKALKTFLENIPDESNLAFVVVVHLLPDHESHLAELLQPHVRMPVQQVNESTPLEANHIYVIPPNANLSAIDTHLRLAQLESRKTRAPIDHFLRTLAKTHDGNAIAVILTGSGSDGTLGVKDIKANGGLVIVQDPNEAEYDGMPQSAIATGLADLILPVKEIPAAILGYTRTEPRVPIPTDGEEVPQTEQALLQKIFAHLRARTDRDFSHYKRSTVLRRIARRMQIHYLDDLGQYVEYLREQPDEVRALGDDLLITVTHFFRDPEVFEKLQSQYIGVLFDQKSAEGSVRVWSVGCATGEEAYSLAMLLVEEARRRESHAEIQVFASDLHASSLEKAREGFYPRDIESDVSPERLRQFFKKEHGGYRVSKELRDLVVFAPHNILADPPFSRIDLISCRNLLIYLDRDVQRDVIELFHYALNPEGILLLGSAESIDALDLFRVEDKKMCLFRKRNVPAREPRLPVFPLTRGRFLQGQTALAAHPGSSESYAMLHQHMLEHNVPPSILISPDNKLVHLSDNAGRFLIHPGGQPTSNPFKVVRPELRAELQASLETARSKKIPLDCRPIRVQFNGHAAAVVLHVRPALEADREGFVLVIFEERELEKPKRRGKGKAAGDGDVGRVEELEAELAISRERYENIIEEYETSQEEMKASGEEMQSSNEELRSTMEELETSKEELQSINEELQTINQQNRHKVEELAQLSSDLQNLLAATDIATLFLDRDLRILRFTPKLGNLFNIRVTDRGRPLSDLTNRMRYPDLIADAEAVLKGLVPTEREVQDDGGHWYLERIAPYRLGDDRLEGLAITFIDIHTRKVAEEGVRASAERLRKMINVDVVSILIFDQTGTLTDCNDTFAKVIGYSKEEITSGKLEIRAITPPEYLDLTEAELRRLAVTGRMGPYETECLKKDGSRLWMLFTGASLGDGTLIEYGIDISDRKRAEQQLTAASADLRLTHGTLLRANNDLQHFSYAVSHDMQEPLRMVILYTQLLERDYRAALDEQARQYIDYAIEGARRMESLLKDLRDYWSASEHKGEDLVPVDCNKILERALAYLETAVRETGATITADPLPVVRAEQYPLGLLFQNLISNAIKYHRKDIPPRIHVSAQKNGAGWSFSVSDNGLGIQPEYHETIFEPFTRLQGRQYPGTGLGLAMCRKIVERYHGRIWVDSTVGQGSIFHFALPGGGEGET